MTVSVGWIEFTGRGAVSDSQCRLDRVQGQGVLSVTVSVGWIEFTGRGCNQ